MTTELWHELEDKQAESLVGGYQCTTGLITELGTFGAGANYLVIDNKAHDVTTETASGNRGSFSWGASELAGAFDIAKRAQANNQQVQICYSEYKLSPYYDTDFYLLGIATRGTTGAKSRTVPYMGSAQSGVGIFQKR